MWIFMLLKGEYDKRIGSNFKINSFKIWLNLANITNIINHQN